MSSGRKERVLITCSTFEVAKVVQPAKFYDVTKVYLIHYGNRSIYNEFFEEVKGQLLEWKPLLDLVTEYDKEPVYDFTKMMNTILTIISIEKNQADVPDIFVNISSGTHEFTAAAVMASMMWDNIIAFTTPTAEFTVGDDKMKDVYYDRGRPIGLTKSTKSPIRVAGYSVPKPDRKLVVGLGILRTRLDNNEKISAPYMIKELDSRGLMKATYLPSRRSEGKPDQKTIMYYQRNFIDKWIDAKWVDRVSKRELEITREGEQILNTFLDCYSVIPSAEASRP